MTPSPTPRSLRPQTARLRFNRRGTTLVAVATTILSLVTTASLLHARDSVAHSDAIRSNGRVATSGGLRSTSRYVGDSADAVAAVSRFHAAIASGDSATAVALLAPDALIIESGDVQTGAEYRSHHLAADIAFASSVPSTYTVIQAIVRGDVAWITTTSTTVGTSRGRAVKSAGAELMVLSRTAASWTIRTVHWSSHALRQ